jgi:hypothetical protein
MAAIALPLGGGEAPFPEIAWVFNALIDAASSLLLILIGTHLGFRRSGIAAASIWAIAPWSVTFSIGGMETSLLVCLMLGTFYLYLSERPVWAALTASLGVLARPDSLIYLAPIAVARLLRFHPRCKREPRPRSLEALAFALPLALWGQRNSQIVVAMGLPLAVSDYLRRSKPVDLSLVSHTASAGIVLGHFHRR